MTQIARFMGPTWGPPGSCRPQMGPMLAPWTLLSGELTLWASAFPVTKDAVGTFQLRAWIVTICRAYNSTREFVKYDCSVTTPQICIFCLVWYELHSIRRKYTTWEKLSASRCMYAKKTIEFHKFHVFITVTTLATTRMLNVWNGCCMI